MFNAVSGRLAPLNGKRATIGGAVGKLIDNITDNWLVSVRETNPAILDMFRDAGRGRQRALLPWSGEFAGKYLTGAAQIYALCRKKNLKAALDDFVGELLRYQRPDGYFGPWPEGYEMASQSPPMNYAFRSGEGDKSPLWDAWGHYHMMLGLLTWHSVTGVAEALAAAEKIAGFFMANFYADGKPGLSASGSTEMNLAPVHAFALLYGITGKDEYLDFARCIIGELELPGNGDFYRLALGGAEFCDMPKPRWESLHTVQGLAAMYEATGEKEYFEAFKHIWWSIVKTDLHNTGGFSTDEQAVGNPYKNGAIETCCTVPFMAAAADMLRLSGDPVVCDIIEMSTLNAGMASFSPSGRWSTYDTPMEGYKRASYDSIHFQCRPGSPDLNCCSVNAPRALGLINEWMYMTGGRDITVNFYGGSVTEFDFHGKRVVVRQETAYPYEGKIRIILSGLEKTDVPVRLRIPFWSKGSRIFLNKAQLPSPEPGSYYSLGCEWSNRDEILLELGTPFSIWRGEGDKQGRTALYRGPLLLCCDEYYCECDAENPPELNAASLRLLSMESTRSSGYVFNISDGSKKLALCDMYSAGVGGTPYTTWLRLDGCLPSEFSRTNPLRLAIIAEG